MSKKVISLPLDVVDMNVVYDILKLVSENKALPIYYISSKKREKFKTFLSNYNKKINSEYVKFSKNLGLFHTHQPTKEDLKRKLTPDFSTGDIPDANQKEWSKLSRLGASLLKECEQGFWQKKLAFFELLLSSDYYPPFFRNAISDFELCKRSFGKVEFMKRTKIKEDNESRCVRGWLKWFGLLIPSRNIHIDRANLERYLSLILSTSIVGYLNKKRKSGPAKIHYPKMKAEVLSEVKLAGTDVSHLFDRVFSKFVYVINRPPFVKSAKIVASPSKGRFGVEIYNVKGELVPPSPESVFWDFGL